MESDKSTNFFELDIRVGKIINAEIFEEAIKPAYKLTINFGDLIGTKKTSAQITNYKLGELQDKPCIAVINLGNKQIGPFMSECLVLGSINKNGDVFKITAQYGKTNLRDSDILDLINVDGSIVSNNRSDIYISSIYAEYNYSNQNSKFYENVEIKYENKIIKFKKIVLLIGI